MGLIEELAGAIDAAAPPDVTHVGIVLRDTSDAYLITEPAGHPFGVSATFNKVERRPGEPPHATVERCVREQIGVEPTSLYPIPVVWATGQSRGYYFTGLVDASELAPSGVHRRAMLDQARAKQALLASANSASRHRDVGLLMAAARICVSPHRRILLMVRELHLLGFERLRAVPYMYPIAWRCPVVPAAWTWRSNGARFDDLFEMLPEALRLDGTGRSTYSSADRQRPFGWRDIPFATPRELARRFIAAFPQVAYAGWGPDEAYTRWYIEMMGRTGPNGVVYVHGEYEPDLPGELYATHGQVERVSGPPPGLAEFGLADSVGEEDGRWPPAQTG
jgi:hypothetical protein